MVAGEARQRRQRRVMLVLLRLGCLLRCADARWTPDWVQAMGRRLPGSAAAHSAPCDETESAGSLLVSTISFKTAGNGPYIASNLMSKYQLCKNADSFRVQLCVFFFFNCLIFIVF